MREERRVCTAQPGKPVPCTFGLVDEPLEFAARPATDIEIDPPQSWTQLRPVELAVVANPAEYGHYLPNFRQSRERLAHPCEPQMLNDDVGLAKYLCIAPHTPQKNRIEQQEPEGLPVKRSSNPVQYPARAASADRRGDSIPHSPLLRRP